MDVITCQLVSGRVHESRWVDKVMDLVALQSSRRHDHDAAKENSN